MTLAEARQKLKPPLFFGNIDQIQAVDFIGRVQECVDAINDCPHGSDCEGCEGTEEIACETCDGDGVCNQCGRDCLECDGTGSTDCEECGGKSKHPKCDCLAGFTNDEKNAARTKPKAVKTREDA